MKSALFFLLAGLLGACTPSHIRVRQTPEDAIRAATSRFEARGIALDTAGARPDRLRTGHFCYTVPRLPARHTWDHTFAHPANGPLSFTHEGDMAAQDAAREACPYRLQASVVSGSDEKGTRLVVETAWWRVSPGRCVPVGDPLLGHLSCTYRYTGATAPDNVERFLYGLLNGL